MITIKQVFDWIKLHRKKFAFDYPDDLLSNEIANCCVNDSILCIFDEQKNIEGVVCWRLDVERKVMFVLDILTIKPGVVKSMMKVFNTRFPGYVIEGVKRGSVQRKFNNTIKLQNRL